MNDREENRRKSVRNGLWSVLQQGMTVGLNAIAGILLVVFVSVEDYGIYSYAMSLCAIGTAVMSAGISGLSVKELVADRVNNARLVVAFILIRETFAVVGYVLLGAVALIGSDASALMPTLFAGFVLFARALDAPESWFLSEFRSKHTAKARIYVGLAAFALRIGVMVWIPNIWAILTVYVLEAFVVSTIILLLYVRTAGSPGFARPTTARVRGIIRQSWPLLLSGLANQINLRGDIIVLQALLGSTAVGVYAAASRLSELAYFLPVVFMSSTLPLLLQVRRDSGSESVEYKGMLQAAYDRAFWAGVAAALGILLCGGAVISLAFGSEYDGAFAILRVHLMSCPFIFMAAVYSKWIIAEGYFWSSFWRHALGAVVNISLVLILVPRFDLVGAAYASVASYVCSSYIAAFLGRKSRFAAFQMSWALVAPVRYTVRWGQRLMHQRSRKGGE